MEALPYARCIAGKPVSNGGWPDKQPDSLVMDCDAH